jgi:hypothetical protein
VRFRLLLAPVLAAALLVAGCGSGDGPAAPTVPAARTFGFDGFKPQGPVQPGDPVPISFTIRQPSGEPLTKYRRGAGPHTKIHLILVNSDLRTIIHRHPPIAANGKLTDTLTFPTPGRYRLVADAYPDLPGLRNFQLFRTIQVGDTRAASRPPPFEAVQKVNGFVVAIRNKPRLRAIEPAFLTVDVERPDGHDPQLTPWLGALAHAIFFRAGSLAYFHTHVCGPNTPGCTTTFGGTTVSGRSPVPGRLRVGVLLPQSGVWRMFLQFRADGRVVTAPFTLRVA